MRKSLPPVLLAAMALDLGGAETHVISLARELRRRGCTVVVASAGGRMVPMLAEVGIPHVLVPMDSRNPAVLFQSYMQLQRVINKYQIGLIHAHARIPAWISSLVVKKHPTPFVTTYHGTYNAGFPWRYLTTFGQRTIAVSEDVRKHLIGSLDAPADQIRVVPNGFDTEMFRPGLDVTPILTEFGAEATGPHVVHASRLNNAFADVAVNLLAALPELDRQKPGIRLWILGDGNRGDEVRRRAEEINRQLGRQAAVATGARLDVPRFFNLADCVVGVARTAIEAMACGRPVVIAGEGGYRGVLTAEKIPEYAHANFTAREGGELLDPARMATDILGLLQPDSEADRHRFGEVGRAYVVENLSIEAITARILDVYAEVL